MVKAVFPLPDRFTKRRYLLPVHTNGLVSGPDAGAMACPKRIK